MGLFSRSGRARVSLTPNAVRPRQPVTATITTDKPLDKVRSATLEWGYTNFYRYHWAGRADSAAAAANDSLAMIGEVGTNYGGERDTDDWVCVDRVPVAIEAGEFTGTSATFKVPSWAPGSSPELARWSCRLVVDRGGRDVDEHGVFDVVIGRDDVQVVDEPQERTGGDGRTSLDIVLPTLLFGAGETVNGQLVLTPQQDMSDGELSIYWARRQISHPVERAPALGGSSKSGQTIKLGKGIPLLGGVPVTVPFAVPLPGDAPPSASAVHSSLEWFLEATLMYSKWTQGIEKVCRPIMVVNAP